MSYKVKLRGGVKTLLERKGYAVQVLRLPGVIPGARLQVTKGDATRRVAVRTSLDREVGLTRNKKGGWNTLGNVDEVLVAAPISDEERGTVEVLAFQPNDLKRAFDDELASNSQPGRASWKSPIFVALDDAYKGRPKKFIPGLKSRATWTAVVPLSSGDQGSFGLSESIDEFMLRVKKEFAERLRVGVSQVTVSFGLKERDSTK